MIQNKTKTNEFETNLKEQTHKSHKSPATGCFWTLVKKETLAVFEDDV